MSLSNKDAISFSDALSSLTRSEWMATMRDNLTQWQ